MGLGLLSFRPNCLFAGVHRSGIFLLQFLALLLQGFGCVLNPVGKSGSNLGIVGHVVARAQKSGASIAQRRGLVVEHYRLDWEYNGLILFDVVFDLAQGAVVV